MSQTHHIFYAFLGKPHRVTLSFSVLFIHYVQDCYMWQYGYKSKILAASFAVKLVFRLYNLYFGLFFVQQIGNLKYYLCESLLSVRFVTFDF